MTARDQDLASRRQQRALARHLHPDLGGDPTAYVRAMGSLLDPHNPGNHKPGSATSPVTAVSVVTGRSGRRVQLNRRVRRARRILRRRLRPRRFIL